MLAPDGIFRRLCSVEAPVAAEVLGVVFVTGMARDLPDFAESALMAFLAATAILLAMAYWHWRTIIAKWEKLVRWENIPLRRDGTLVIQENEARSRIGAIDTGRFFDVKKEHFAFSGTLYVISQESQKIFVSTRAANAEAILKDAFRIKNYRHDRELVIDRRGLGL